MFLGMMIGVAVVFERKVALRNKLRVISYLQTPNDGFWTLGMDGFVSKR